MPYVEDPERPEAPWTGTELEQLLGWIEYHRTTLLRKCAGLDDAGRKATPIPTSPLSLHGLVRHMAEVERIWFRGAIDGQDTTPIYWNDDVAPDLDFAVADADWEEDLAVWQAEVDAARAIAAAGIDLERTYDSQWRLAPVNFRWALLHMLEEYARHNGHADLIRELVDGTTGD